MTGRVTTTTVVSRFQRLFRGRETAYGQWKQGDVKTVSKPITGEVWEQHLKGKGPFLGIIPITETNDCYFGAIDIDDDTINHAAVAALVDLAQLPLVVCRSKSGGAHLYLFLKDPAPARMVQEKLRRWAKQLNLKNPPNEKGQEPPVEIFPKQVKISPTVVGNWINLPYYGNGSTTRYAVTAEGDQLSIAAFLDYAESKAISAIELEGLEVGGINRFEDGPPCLNTLNNLGYPDGTRNMGLYNVGIYFKLSDEDNWKELLAEYNQDKMDPPLKDPDVKSVIKSLERREYSYRCSDLPIAPHCEKTACKKQKYGISGFRKKKTEASMPEMGNLRKITTDPPRWMLTVSGADIDMQTEDLMLLTRFRRSVMEKCSRIFPLMKQTDWDDILSELLKDHTVIEAPDDAGSMGQFKYLFREFLLRRKNARGLEDLLAGLPVEMGPKVLFRSPDLLKFLERMKFRDYDAPRVFTALREIGAGHKKETVNGAQFQVWFVETPQDEQDEEFTEVKGEDPEF